MAGISPENNKILPVTADSIVKIKNSDEQGEYVALVFGLFGDKEDAVRKTYFEYVAAVQEEYEALARQTETKFLILTHVSASDVHRKVQQVWHELAQKNFRPIS